LPVLGDLLDELARLLAVLLGGADEVLQQLVLPDVHCHLLGEGVQHELTAEGLRGLLGHLRAVLLVLQTTLVITLLVNLARYVTSLGFWLYFWALRTRNSCSSSCPTFTVTCSERASSTS